MPATKTREKALSSAAPIATPARTVEATLPEAESIAQRLADGLASIERQRSVHQDALARIGARLAAIPEALEDADVPLAKLRREQERLPHELATARALALASAGTQAEQPTSEQLATLQARTDALPQILAEAKVTREETLAALAQAQHQLEQERDTHQAALADLAGSAAAQQEAARQAQQQLREATFASFQAERQAKASRVAQAETALAEARAALSAHDTAAQARLAPWPDVKRAYQHAHVPVEDDVTRRCAAALAYRRALRGFLLEPGDWARGMPHRWFLPTSHQLDVRLLDTNTAELEQALARHIAELK